MSVRRNSTVIKNINANKIASPTQTIDCECSCLKYLRYRNSPKPYNKWLYYVNRCSRLPYCACQTLLIILQKSNERRIWRFQKKRGWKTRCIPWVPTSCISCSLHRIWDMFYQSNVFILLLSKNLYMYLIFTIHNMTRYILMCLKYWRNL